MPQQWSAPPEMQIDTSKNYSVSIETNRGTIELELYPQHAPKTASQPASAQARSAGYIPVDPRTRWHANRGAAGCPDQAASSNRA